jgi:hypothetical protein
LPISIGLYGCPHRHAVIKNELDEIVIFGFEDDGAIACGTSCRTHVKSAKNFYRIEQVTLGLIGVLRKRLPSNSGLSLL